VNGDDAPGDEVHAPDRDPLALDQGTADRLLAGTLDPADAPPAYAEVARVLAAAAGPPQPGELAGEAEAVARFAAAAAAGTSRRRRRARLAVASAAVLGLLTVGGVVSVTGGAPTAGAWLNRTVDAVVGHTRTADSHATIAPTAGSTATTTAGSARDGTPPGRVAGATPRRGTYPERLCAAWQPGRGRNLDAAALQALAATAGGADRIPAYCQALDRGQRNGDGGAQEDRPAPPGNPQADKPDQKSGKKSSTRTRPASLTGPDPRSRQDQARTANSCHSPVMPRRLWAPRSSST
jgi:hypothetical protein